MTDAQLNFLVSVQDRDLQELQKRVRETNKLLGGETAKAAAQGSKGFDGFGTKAQLLAGGALVGLAKGAQTAAARASDLGEQVNKTSAIFGPSGKQIVEWSETTARSLGISRVAALEATGTIGNMLVPMGIAPKRAAELSRSLVKAAADMASFNNASPEETLAALQSGLAGETEPLRRFGVFLNADRIAAEALALGLGKTKKPSLEARQALLQLEVATAKHAAAVKEHGKGSLEARQAQLAMETAQQRVKKSAQGSASSLSAAAKAQATYSLVQKDLQKSGAVGDFAKTSTSLANAQRIQKAVQDDLIVSTGEGLLPIQQAANRVVGEATKLLFANQKVGTAAVGVVASLAAGVFLVNGAIKVKTAAVAAHTAATKAWTVAQRALNVALRANPIGLVVTALALLATGLVIAYRRSETFRTIVKQALDVVRGAGEQLAGVFRWFRDHAGDVWSVVRLALTPQLTAIKLLFEAGTTALGGHPRRVPLVPGQRRPDLVRRAQRDREAARRERAGVAADPGERVPDRSVAASSSSATASTASKKLEPLTGALSKVGGFLGKIPGIGDVAAGFNSAAAAAARARIANPSGGLAPQTASLLGTIERLFGGVVLTSGRRTPAENERVGGAPNSDHLSGRAIDLVPRDGWTPGGVALLDRIAAWAATLPQVRWIGWRGVAGHGPGDHLHISTFAKGGIVTGPLLAEIGERRQSNPEVVLPLGSRRGRRILVDAFADARPETAHAPSVIFNAERIEVRDERHLNELASLVWRELAFR